MSSINKKVIMAIVYALVVSGSFYLGTLAYTFYATRNSLSTIPIVSVREFQSNLQSFSGKTFELIADNQTIKIDKEELQQFIEPYIRDYSRREDLRVSSTKLIEHLESLAPRLAIEPINAKLKFANNKAQLFIPHTDGRRLNINQSANLISTAMLEGQSSINLAFTIIEPDITLDKVNTLGITTLLGSGESDYGKSSTSRIHNIKLGLSKFNGIILKPGEEFSFNNNLGEVDAQEGYESELVIKSGKLVKEYGGGICQVSTTVFRAAIDSGLDITERKAHSFAVQYYNPQGFDSTIYPGIVDLKFINDTSNHVLIQARLIGSKLLVEIYGTNDGREVAVDGPHQYDQQPDGSLKAYFVRKITLADGTTNEERFNSTYKPPPSPEERNPLE